MPRPLHSCFQSRSNGCRSDAGIPSSPTAHNPLAVTLGRTRLGCRTSQIYFASDDLGRFGVHGLRRCAVLQLRRGIHRSRRIVPRADLCLAVLSRAEQSSQERVHADCRVHAVCGGDVDFVLRTLSIRDWLRDGLDLQIWLQRTRHWHLHLPESSRRLP